MTTEPIIHRVEVQGWPLTLTGPTGTEEPCVEDEVLAQRLGFDRPRDIRKIIKRYEKSGDLSGISQRATVARYESRPGVWQERKVQVYLLTEEQACFIIAKSETPVANNILRDIIRVFTLARRGLLPQQRVTFDLAPVTQAIELLATQLQTSLIHISSRLENMERRQTSTENQIRDYVADAEPMAADPRLSEHDLCKQDIQDLVTQLAATAGISTHAALGRFRRAMKIPGYNALKSRAYPTAARWLQHEIDHYARERANPTPTVLETLADRDESPTNVTPIRRAP